MFEGCGRVLLGEAGKEVLAGMVVLLMLSRLRGSRRGVAQQPVPSRDNCPWPCLQSGFFCRPHAAAQVAAQSGVQAATTVAAGCLLGLIALQEATGSTAVHQPPHPPSPSGELSGPGVGSLLIRAQSICPACRGL